MRMKSKCKLNHDNSVPSLLVTHFIGPCHFRISIFIFFMFLPFETRDGNEILERKKINQQILKLPSTAKNAKPNLYGCAHTNWISLCKIDLPTKLEIEVYGFYQWQSEREI